MLATEDENEYEARMLNNLIGGDTNSFLFRIIREEKGYCYSAYSRYDKKTKTILLTIGLDYSNIEDTIKEIKNQISLIQVGKFKNKYIEDYKKAQINIYKKGPTTDLGFENKIVSNVIFKENKDIEKVKQINKEGIKQVGNKLNLDTIYILKAKRGNNEKN